MFQEDVPKVLINMTNTATAGFDFEDPEKFPNRLLVQGKCDEVVQDICEKVGWADDLKSHISAVPPPVKVEE
jgi:hypothetical protein